MSKFRGIKRRTDDINFDGVVRSSATRDGISVAIGGSNQAPINIRVAAQQSSGAPIVPALWEVSFLKGSACQQKAGIAGTLDDLNGHNRQWFPSDATVILGTIDGALMPRIEWNRASWRIPVKPHFFRKFARGFASIGCLRYYGGLHSRRYDSIANISINTRPLDRIQLRIKPEGHTDYFCQIPQPDLWPNIHPFAECRTLYVWPLVRENLVDSHWQLLEVQIDGYGNWDIDYVGLVFQSTESSGL
jgi:hypothetical protein